MQGWPSAMKVKQMVIPHVRLYSCASHMAKTTCDSQREMTKRRCRRTSPDLRRAHMENGAFLLEFEAPDEAVNLFRRVPPRAIAPTSLLSGSAWQSAVDMYRTMERKGFRVTSDIGCLIPDSRYSTYQHGATKKGHQRTFAFFARWIPEKLDVRNEFGWPCSAQISHLCHRRSCARVDHLVVEEQWRNLKRNYCGVNGVCDCGNEIKCLRRYQPSEQCDNPRFCKSAEEVEAVLKEAPAYVMHGKERFLTRDRKAKQRLVNRKKRRRKQALHAHATKRRQSRLVRRL